MPLTLWPVEVLVSAEEDLQAQRQAQEHFFGRPEALALGLSSETEAGPGCVIDARS